MLIFILEINVSELILEEYNTANKFIILARESLIPLISVSADNIEECLKK